MSRGIHHITAIAGDPQRNLDFYAGFLGLRLVKKTVNFDDPNTYHLYYGDALGHPGTILTFFPWAGMRRGQRGVGSVAAFSFSVPRTSLGFWLERLSARNLQFEREERFGDPVLAFDDSDGLRLELTFHTEAEEVADIIPWEEGPVSPEHALRGFHSVTLWEESVEATAALLTQRLGFQKSDTDGPLHRYTTSHAGGRVGPGRVVDIRVAENFWPGVTGAGTVHHVAFRAADDAAQLALQEDLVEDGLAPTPVIDRQYFHSIYFRKPGGVLFEVATDPPGFTVDEPPKRSAPRSNCRPSMKGCDHSSRPPYRPCTRLPRTTNQFLTRLTLRSLTAGFPRRVQPKPCSSSTAPAVMKTTSSRSGGCSSPAPTC